MAPSEAKLLRRPVLALCQAKGLLAHSCGDSRSCLGSPGLPDLIAVGERGLLLAELKTAGGETSADQDMWAWMLARARIPYRLYRPADLDSGQIETDLDAIR